MCRKFQTSEVVTNNKNFYSFLVVVVPSLFVLAMKVLIENVDGMCEYYLYFIISINYIEELHDGTEIRNFSSSVEKYFSIREEKFHISKRPCNVLFII